MTELEEQMARFNAATAEAGRPDIKAFREHPEKPDTFQIAGFNLRDQAARLIVYRAHWLAYNGTGKTRCADCYVRELPTVNVPAGFDCGHPKEWA